MTDRSFRGTSAERRARATWSRITEPGDAVAGRFVAEVGAVEALDAVRRGVVPDPHGAKWKVRLAEGDVRRDLDRLTALDGRLVIPGDTEWPVPLDDLAERAPFCLWVRGPGSPTNPVEPLHSVSVVGARAATGYGQHVATTVASGLAMRGIPVVSGAAYGIDAAAHRGALGVDGPTVAVVATGLDRSYPKGNELLLDAIGARGCLVSEVPPESGPTRWRFLQRNRLIAALTGATVVVEAAWRSGAASTARHAADLGRGVAAVPGPVTSAASAGCHVLLRDGAVCVTDADEVLELIMPLGSVTSPRPVGRSAVHDDLDEEEIRVLDAVPVRGAAPEHDLCRGAGLDPDSVRGCLGRLELRDLVERAPDGWRLARGMRARRPSSERFRG
jgi:DNA processing protein